MRKVLVIGMGAGDPEYMTVQSIEALNTARVLFLLEKGNESSDLEALRREVCDRFVRGDAPRLVAVADPPRKRGASGDEQRAAVSAWRGARATLLTRLINEELAPGETGAFLVWGDPSLYDSILDVLKDIEAGGAVEFSYDMIPGISAVSALAARHRIMLNRIGGSVHITTGRRLRDRGLPEGADDVVVMLDADLAFTTVAPDGLDIYWGAYLGTPDEMLLAGPLAELADEIVRVRRAARQRKGWMFDTYLLRRRTV
jgi:precorrin-6A synthase